jgi:hypothetical protein
MSYIPAIGGVIGAGMGALSAGLPKTKHDLRTGEVRSRSKSDRVLSGILMGGLGAYQGVAIGRLINNRFIKPSQHVIPEAFKGLKSNRDIKKVVHEFARSNHPDVGGDTKKFQQFMEDYQKYQKHPSFPKTASIKISSFIDELCKIYM